MNVTALLPYAHIVLVLLVSIRVLLRPYRQPASRVAWMVVIATLPFAGFFAYLLFGEVNIGRKRVARVQKVVSEIQTEAAASGLDPQHFHPAGPAQYEHLFRVGHSISGLNPVTGNSGMLMEDSNSTIDTMVADIDAAKRHVHLLFYIWLPDGNGCKMVAALKRAVARGVTVRAMADGLGSRLLIKSEHWRSMRDAGVKVAVALPIGNPLLRPFAGRIDLRNHRKIVVIDGSITYCGSQNCADPEFLVKARYAPWVDAVIRFQGPIAKQNQYLFACDWMSHVDEDLSLLLREPASATENGFAAQVTGTGPTVRFSAMPEMFVSIMHAARRELVITTPYFVPSESMLDALCAAAYRGVATSIIFPARNDSRIVAAASRSYYSALLEAGINIFEYEGGLLHSKTLTVDGNVSLIGSANMDRRSFDLNYENAILFTDCELTASVYKRQQEYLRSARRVTATEIGDWGMPHRLLNNAVAMFGPVL
jgi:cardiolipin synthase A/B